MKSLKKRVATFLCVAAAVCFAVGLGLFAGSFKAYAETSDSLTMERGAYVRADDSATGLRFVASMSKNAYESISESVTEAGMFIMPAEYLAKYGELTAENLFGDSAVYTAAKEEGKTRIIGITYGGMVYSEGYNRYEIRGTISDIFETNYTRNFVARAYLKKNDGSVIMAEYSDGNYVNNVRNVANVAKLALASNVSYSGKQLAALADYTDFAESITGEKYISLFEPQTSGNTTGTVTWDSVEKAYKFAFDAMEGNERGLAINADFFYKIAGKTGATALSFKVKAGSESIKNLIYSYAPWDGTAVSYPEVNNTDYTEITFDFKSIPKDANGNFKSPFILALETSYVSNYIYIKDVTVVKTYEVVKIIDADKLGVEGSQLNNNNGDLRFALSDKHPAGATGSVLKSNINFETEWQGNSFKLASPVSAADYEAVSLRVYVENSSLDKVTAVMYKYGETNAAKFVYNQDIPTNRWYNLTVEASALTNAEGNIEGIALFIPTKTVPEIYVDSVVLMGNPVTHKYLVENGTTEYSVLISESATETERTAAEEFINLFKKATGIDISVAKDVSDCAKYISIGNTEALALSGISLTKDELGLNGYKIITSENNIYVCGATDKGTLYGVYGLLTELFDFDAYFKDTYTIKENVTTLELSEFSHVEVPDIERRVVGNGGVNYVYGDRTTQNRLRFENFGDDFILIDGKMAHNSISYVTGKSGENDNWYYKSGKLFGSVDRTKQLCYSARGNTTDYNNMVNAAFETLKAALINEPNKTIVTFSCEDNYSNCRCSACQSSDSKGYNETDRVIQFVNNVYNKVLEWFAGEGASYKRDLDMVVYAYLTTASAPKQIKPVSGVKVLYAPIGLDFTSDITASVNASIYEEAQKWNDMTDEMYLWIYSANFYYYLAPYLNVDSMQSYYRFAKSAGTKWIFDQGQHDNAFATGFSNLKTYIASKLAWNTEADVAALTDKFFNAYFGPASSAMRTFYNGYNAAYKAASGLHKELSCQVPPASSYWTKNDLIGWIQNCQTALEAIASLESSDPTAYALYHKHIVGERMSPVYLLIELYRSELSQTDKTNYIDMFKQDVLETGISFPKESGAQTFDSLYASWGTGSVAAVTVDLASPEVKANVGDSVVSVRLKGKSVSAENYTVSGGILTFKPEYIGSLGEGNHLFDITWGSGAISLYVTVTDNMAPQYEVTNRGPFEAGEIELPAATNKAGTYQNLTPVYYLDGEEKEENEIVTLEEGTYTLTVKFMRKGKLVEGGDITVDLVVVSKVVYNIGDTIDMDETTVSAVQNFGLSGIWSTVIVSSADISGYNGTLAEFHNNGSSLYAHAANVALNNSITVREGMNYIKVRFFISSSADFSMDTRFYRSDRTNHQVESDVWFDATTQIPANVWTNVFLPVSDFAVNGKIEGFKFGCFTDQANVKVYIDDITIVRLEKGQIDLNGTQIGYIGSGNYWHNGETVTGSEIVLDNGSAYCNANLIFATPVTVTNETKIILRIRMSKAMSGGMLAFFNSKSEHKASFTDASGAAPVSDYVDVTLNLSDFVEDGQFKSISIGVWGNVEGTLTLYIASIKVI